MNDPFAAFDPIAQQKNAPASSAYTTAPMSMRMSGPSGASMGGQQQYPQYASGVPPAAPFAMTHNPYGMGPQQGIQTSLPGQNGGQNGAAFMTQPSGAAHTGFNGLQQQQQHHQQQQQQPGPYPAQVNPFNALSSGQHSTNAGSFGGQPVMYDSIKNLLSPKAANPFATNPTPSSTLGPTPAVPVAMGHQSSTVIDFDPFSPRAPSAAPTFDDPADQMGFGTGADAIAKRQSQRQTQDAARHQLGLDTTAFQRASTTVPKISLKDTPGLDQDPRCKSEATRPTASSGFDDDSSFFTDNGEAFAGQTFTNVDDDVPMASTQTNGGPQATVMVDAHCGPGEFDVTFESGRKLGVLMERVDVWGKKDERRHEIAVVKLVVESGAADQVGVTVGSSVIAINGRDVTSDSYNSVLEMIKTVPRPMLMRFKRGTVNKDTTQGNVLTRISNGTFSVGNFTSGNAAWTPKYFAFGGAKMDVLQLFISRAAYHECVISLYEKRVVHTQIQSFRLCRDHKISPIKSKIYKGYGNLHYFSLSVPSLRFVAAKFSSEDYETIKNIWTHTFEAIERKKRMGY